MLLTEEQARTKWCPMVRVLHYVNLSDDANAVSVNRGLSLEEHASVCKAEENHDEKLPHSCRCVASDCMMWRSSPSLTINNPTRQPGAGQTIDRSRGYCGLAGRAE